MPFRICCPCHFGLESTLTFEVRRLGGTDIDTRDGRVSFTGDWEHIARANIELRTAERVGILLAEFPAMSFEELFQGVRQIPWEQFIDRRDTFPVKGYALNSQLYSVPDCQSIVKKAVVERLKSAYHLSWFEETGALHQIQFSIFKDQVSIILDTSGPGLHKRGYRKNANEAPIRETLAAGIVDLAHIRGDSIVTDPFCGSGTLLIEAGMKALNIAPGVSRPFSAERWRQMSKSYWQDARENALDAMKRDATFVAYGSDIDAESVELSMENAKKVGLGSRIHVKEAPVAAFTYEDSGDAIMLTNPPYGERMLDIEEAKTLYRTLAKRVKPSATRPLYLITADEEFEQVFGKKADKRRKLYNGMIRCQLYMYFKGGKR